MNRIDPKAVYAAFADSLFQPEEIEGKKIPEGAILAEGILATVGFHPERLRSHAEEVRTWLSLLPHQFRKDQGGGWSFLNACNQEDGRQWTGLHERMDQLFTMGIALGMAEWCIPRDMWDIFPGQLPYVSIDLSAGKPE